MESIWIFCKDKVLERDIYTVLEETLKEEKQKKDILEYELKIWDQKSKDNINKLDYFITDITVTSFYSKIPNHKILILISNTHLLPNEWDGRIIKKSTLKELLVWFENRKQHITNMKENNPKVKEPVRAKPVDINQTQVEPTITTEDSGDSSSSLVMRSKNIKRYTLIQNGLNQNKTIGVWSPLSRMGVTTFVLNFAIFLAAQKTSTVVLEGLSEKHFLKTVLSKIDKVPDGWKSYPRVLHDESIEIDRFYWNYKGVLWLPLDDDDTEKIVWNDESVYYYVKNIQDFDIALCDLPTGPFETHTELMLSHLDELWIIADDSYHQLHAYRNYISEIINQYPYIKVQLIFNKTFPFSQHENLSKDLDLPILTSFPNVFEEVMKNNYENRPLVDNRKVSELFEPHYKKLYKHLTGKDIKLPIRKKIKSILKKNIATL